MNKTQKDLLTIGSTTIKDINELNAEYISSLSRVLNVDLTSTPSSNIYLLANAHNTDLINAQIDYLTILNNINNYFNTNRFDGFINGSYAGMRNALMALSYIADAKIVDTDTNATIKIVLLANLDDQQNPIDLTIYKEEIAKSIHEARAVGILTDISEGAVVVTVPASTGEQKTYGFYNGERRAFDIEVTYNIDFEEDFTNYDFDSQIKAAIGSLYGQNYGYLGKDIKIQDFYALAKDIAGINDLSIKFTDTAAKQDYTNTDVVIDITEIFTINNVTTKQGN
ncbi:DUF276 domain-containing protein [Rickettsiales bacterium LUAb2]